jgi:hypothetical protein
MKKYTFNFSRILVSALIATTLGTKANESAQAPHHLTGIVKTIKIHLATKLKPWSRKLLKSSETYPHLVQELQTHILSFDAEVVKPLKQIQKGSASDALTKQASEIVDDLHKMSTEMHSKMKELVGSYSPARYTLVLNQSKKNMSGQVDSVIHKLRKLKKVCEEQNKPDLLEEISSLETAVEDFAKQHQNTYVDICNRIASWVKDAYLK